MQVVVGQDAGAVANTTITAVHFVVNSDGVLETSESAAQILVSASPPLQEPLTVS